MFHLDNDQPKRSQFYKYRDDILEKNALVAHEERDKPIIQEEDEPFTLFDPAPIIEYQQKLERVNKTYQEDKDPDKAEINYLEIIDEMPFYPDAYIELGDLFVKVKNNAKAIRYYTQAMTRCPYDIDTDVKLALQQDRANKEALKNKKIPPFLDFEIKPFLETAKKRKEEEKNFRIRYHSKLRRQLTGAGFLNINALTANRVDDIELTSPALSNGAVIYSYMASLALDHNDLMITQYFYKKAILKFKYDLYSITHLAISYRFTDEREHALKELTRYINKYEDYYMYYARALVNGELDNLRQEQEDFIKFMCSATQGEMKGIPYNNSEILTIILQKPIDLDILPIFVESEEQAKRICNIQKAFLCGQFLGNIDAEIEFITALIKQNPAQHFYYGYRGFLYHQQSKQDLAMLDFSLAILFGPPCALVNYYHCRASIFLANYELVYANFEESNAANSIPTQPTERNSSQIRSTLNYQFASECLDRGVNRLLAGYLIQAEKIFYLGLLFNPTALLYYHYALALGLQSKYNFALHELDNAKASLFCDLTLGQSVELLVSIFTEELNHEHHISESHRKKSERALLKESTQPPIEPEKHRKTPPQKPLTGSNFQPLKKHSINTVLIQSLLKEQEIKNPEADEVLFQQEIIEKNNRDEAEKLKKEKNKNKKKKQKSLRKERLQHSEHKTEAAGSCSDTEVDISELTLIKKLDIHNIILTLSDLEKKVFNYFAPCKNHPDYKKTNKLLMVGGSIIGKVREYLLNIAPPILNDIDTVTDIFLHILQECCPDLKPIKEVDGLLQITIDGIRIDIMHKDNLCNLSNDAMERDFFALYMDETGFIYDPTGFSIYNIQNMRLRSIDLTAFTFKTDPLRILRAIYLSIKYELSLSDVKKQIFEDKKLLVPRLTDNEGKLEKLLIPGRFNALLRRNFSQHLALKNYQLMRDLGILVILFPAICSYLETDHDWICQQLSQTDTVVRVNLNIIYANFIVSAIMNEALVWQQPAPQTETINKFYEIRADNQLSKSLLFRSQFPKSETLHGYLSRSITSWKFFHQTKDTPSTSLLPQTERKTQNNRFGYYN
jgi:tRNA nucleotidyltransferase/poly(A) polymerase